MTCATAFTTGDDSYKLQSVTASFEAKSGNPQNFKASLYTDNGSGRPGSKIVDLSGNAPDTDTNHIYTCPDDNSGCDFSTSTTYHLVFSADRGNQSGNHFYKWDVTSSDNQTQTPSNNGWTIANTGTAKAGKGSWSQLRKTWEMGRGCVIMKGVTLELHEQRLSTWLQGF